jgi:subtilisin family serine protease
VLLGQDLLVLFAASNDGVEHGDASIGSPGNGKNCLTVGAAESIALPIDTVASFSSRGPTSDGRLKPDVVGPGDAITSAAASGAPGLATCATTVMSGTSMATPAVAGAAALVRQFLVEGQHQVYSRAGHAASSYSEASPSAALLKALLISSTAPLTCARARARTAAIATMRRGDARSWMLFTL